MIPLPKEERLDDEQWHADGVSLSEEKEYVISRVRDAGASHPPAEEAARANRQQPAYYGHCCRSRQTRRESKGAQNAHQGQAPGQRDESSVDATVAADPGRHASNVSTVLPSQQRVGRARETPVRPVAAKVGVRSDLCRSGLFDCSARVPKDRR
jgi:hypothetical protein